MTQTDRMNNHISCALSAEVTTWLSEFVCSTEDMNVTYIYCKQRIRCLATVSISILRPKL